MTRQHFELLAEEVYRFLHEDGSPTPLRKEQAEIAARLMGQACIRINPRFDPERFNKACGL